MTTYYEKYLKYKQKYLSILSNDKYQNGGGGHAFMKEIGKPTDRMNVSDYNTLKNEISQLLRTNNIMFETPKELPDKTSFGDLDIVYHSFDVNDIKKMFEDTGVKIFKKNGSILHVLYEKNNKQYEIDMIKTDKEYFESALFYLSYGDFGSLVGKALKQFGLTFGDIGLYIDDVGSSGLLPKYTPINKTFYMTGNTKIIIETVLELDYTKYTNGFTSSDDFSNWLASSSIFTNPIIFCSRNRKDVDTATSRPFYSQFVEKLFIKKYGNDGLKIMQDCVQRVDDNIHDINKADKKEFQLSFINKLGLNAKFEHYKEQYFAEKKIHDEQNIIKAKIDGSVYIKAGVNKKNINTAKTQFQAFVLGKYNIPFFEYAKISSELTIENDLLEFVQKNKHLIE